MGVALAGIRKRRGAYRVLVGKPEGTVPLEDPSINGRIILRWSFRKWDVGVWTVLIWLRIGTGGKPLLMRQKFGEFFDQLRTG
jgi:hypothetical protein